MNISNSEGKSLSRIYKDLLALSVKVGKVIEDGLLVWRGAVKPVVHIYDFICAFSVLIPAPHLKPDDFVVIRYCEWPNLQVIMMYLLVRSVKGFHGTVIENKLNFFPVFSVRGGNFHVHL